MATTRAERMREQRMPLIGSALYNDGYEKA
jgi:hypothetical protein